MEVMAIVAVRRCSDGQNHNKIINKSQISVWIGSYTSKYYGLFKPRHFGNTEDNTVVCDLDARAKYTYFSDIALVFS